jgi:hypothetical protein
MLYIELMGHLTPEMQVWTTYAVWVNVDIPVPEDIEWARHLAQAFTALPPEKWYRAAMR